MYWTSQFINVKKEVEIIISEVLLEGAILSFDIDKDMHEEVVITINEKSVIEYFKQSYDEKELKGLFGIE